MRVQWSQNAVEHRVNIYDHIVLNSPTYAKRRGDKITRRSEQITDQLLAGRNVQEYQTDDIREPIKKSYRIIYRIKPQQIDVVAVIHAARLLPEDI